LQRPRKRRPFGGFRIAKLRRDNVLRMQAGAKVTGFAMEAKAEALWSEKIFQGEGRSVSSGGSYSCHRFGHWRKIWTVEVSRPGAGRKVLHRRNRSGPSDLGRIADSRQIWEKLHAG
jgi:hypothetical protein